MNINKYKSQSKASRVKKISNIRSKNLIVNTQNDPLNADIIKAWNGSELTQRFRK